MGILLALAPFIVFAVVAQFASSMTGLIAAAVCSAALLVRDRLRPDRKPKILEIGTLVLFGGLSLYAALGNAAWSVIGVRLCVDAGLLLIVLVSMAVRRPFTLEYAREQVAPQFWANPIFIRTNYILTTAWAAAFAVMVIAEAALIYVPAVPSRIGLIAIVAALVGAMTFTSWYPARVKAKNAAQGMT